MADFRGGGIRGGEAYIMRGSIPAYFDTDHSFLSFIGCSQGETEGASPFRSSVCGVMPECVLRGADDGAGQRKDRDDLLTLRQGAGRAGGQLGYLPHLRDDYELPVIYSYLTNKLYFVIPTVDYECNVYNLSVFTPKKCILIKYVVFKAYS